jgi:hypothetical protein
MLLSSSQVSVNEELEPALVIERLSTENAELRAELRCAKVGRDLGPSTFITTHGALSVHKLLEVSICGSHACP